MADIRRSLTALLALWADNSSNEISAQDDRDVLISAYVPQGFCDFTIGLEQNVPISVADQIGKSVIYVNTVGKGNRLSYFDGTSWTLFTPQPFALAGLTGLTDAKNYDLFSSASIPTHSSTNTGTDVVTWSANPGWTTGAYVYVTATLAGLTAGTHYWYARASATTGSFHTTLADTLTAANKVNLTADVTQTLVGIFADLGPTWDTGGGSNVARGTGAGSTALVDQDGADLNAVTVTGSIGAGTIAAKCGLHIATVRTTATTTVESSIGGVTTQVGGKQFVWSKYNRPDLFLSVIDTTNTGVYNTDTIRQMFAAAGNQVAFVTGQNTPYTARVITSINIASASGRASKVGVGVDSTSAFSGLVGEAYASSASSTTHTMMGVHAGHAIGYHFLSWNQKGGDGTANTFIGDNSADGSQSGLHATIEGSS